jgi:hypothetical protein
MSEPIWLLVIHHHTRFPFIVDETYTPRSIGTIQFYISTILADFFRKVLFTNSPITAMGVW